MSEPEALSRTDGIGVGPVLTAVGCDDCPYPPGSDGLESTAFWRPAANERTTAP
jgi:hypothetical protein